MTGDERRVKEQGCRGAADEREQGGKEAEVNSLLLLCSFTHHSILDTN